MSMTEEAPIIGCSMQIIMHAGNARNEVRDAMRLAREGDFGGANACMEHAKTEIVSAHNLQTGVLQETAGNPSYSPCLLFTHAQDTLMTIQTEVNLGEEMLKTLALVFGRLAKLEQAVKV